MYDTLGVKGLIYVSGHPLPGSGHKNESVKVYLHEGQYISRMPFIAE